jgi:hypothetical protein
LTKAIFNVVMFEKENFDEVIIQKCFIIFVDFDEVIFDRVTCFWLLLITLPVYVIYKGVL